MKLLFIALVTALVGLSAANRASTDVYPCPHSGTTRLAHLSTCSQFVQCVNGVAVEESCADGLFFNEESQQCTTAALANCNVEQTPCPKWTDPENLVFLTNGNSCNQYFMCYDGEPLALECASGLNFNSLTSQCDQVGCSTSHWSCGSLNGRYPDDTDCNRFYHCQNGVQYGGQCADGFAFDSKTSRCVLAHQSTCGYFTTVPDTTWVTEQSTVSCAPTCSTPTFPTQTTTARTTTTQKPQTTTTAKTSTTHKHSTTTAKTTTPKATTTTQKPQTTTTAKTTHHHSTTTAKTTTPKATTTTQKPQTTTTAKTSTTHHHTTAKTTTPKATTTTTTAAPELNLDSFCKTEEVGRSAMVAHPERCDWYISCNYGHGTVGKCTILHIFSPTKQRCVVGYSSTCKYADELDEADESVEHFVAVEAGIEG